VTHLLWRRTLALDPLLAGTLGRANREPQFRVNSRFAALSAAKRKRMVASENALSECAAARSHRSCGQELTT
jgi:hypothetical protein